MQWDLTQLDTDVTGRLKVRRVFKDGELVREGYSLLEIGDDQNLAQIEQQA